MHSMHPVLLIAFYWWRLDHSTVVVSEVYRLHQLWFFPLWWREISHTGTWNSLLPSPVPLQIASSSQVWCAVAGEELSLVSPMVHTWYFSHQLQTQFVWVSLVSPNGSFFARLSHKQRKQGYFVHPPCCPGSMHTIFKTVQIFQLCSEYFNFSNTCFILS